MHILFFQSTYAQVPCRSCSATRDNANLNSGRQRFSGVDGDLVILSRRHNTDAVSLQVEMFLAARPRFTFDDVVTRLKRSRRVTAKNPICVRRALVERVLCNSLLVHNMG